MPLTENPPTLRLTYRDLSKTFALSEQLQIEVD